MQTTWLDRLTDRSFLGAVSTAVGSAAAAYAIWQTHGVPVTDKVNATMTAMLAVAAVVSIFTHSEKKKDAAIAVANAPQAPAAVNVGSAATVNAGETTSPTQGA
jgi:hypothetical protein